MQQNIESETSWKYCIKFDTDLRQYDVNPVNIEDCYFGEIYFPTREIANNAIEEIVKPFMKQHPEFVW